MFNVLCIVLAVIIAGCTIERSPKKQTPAYEDPFEFLRNTDVSSVEGRTSVEGYTSERPILATDGWLDGLPIPIYISSEFDDSHVAILRNSMKMWEDAAGQDLFDYKGRIDDKGNDYIKEFRMSLKDMKNVMYVANFEKWDEKAAFYAGTTPMRLTLVGDDLERGVLHTSDMYFNRRSLWSLGHISLHEMGHFLGLGHVDVFEDPHSIMHAAFPIDMDLNGVILSKDPIEAVLSEGDIKRLHQIYGCLGSACRN
ncbi:MAG: matrixin family metalloprotease [Proteobacteria bacterium]|nr:matrixin family metalloprotease [Pseudomonadota bacterium]